MLVGTIVGVIVIPGLYVLFERIASRNKKEQLVDQSLPSNPPNNNGHAPQPTNSLAAQTNHNV